MSPAFDFFVQFFYDLLDLLGFLERRRRSDQPGEGASAARPPILEYGFMSGLLGSMSAFILLILLFLLLYLVRPFVMTWTVCCWQAFAPVIGIVFGFIGRVSSERLRNRLGVTHIDADVFAKLTVVAFGFLGAFLYTVLLYAIEWIQAG
ncbi:MAG TPA: hypothetical protein G4O08_12170 [Anaerolineae bacterium]|nr:hypothetical protein [Anaerolineae bacterium]